MFVQTLQKSDRRIPALVVVLFSLFALLAFGSPAQASSVTPGVSKIPVGAAPPARVGTPAANFKRRGGGALLPKKQVRAITPRLLSSTLPASVNLLGYSVPVGDQGSVGSCVSWTISYAMLGWYARRDNVAGQPFHPMYTYSQTHVDNSPGGGGSYAHNALDIVYTQGNDTMAHYSRSTTDFVNLPNASERANAANYRIAGWQTVFANPSGGGGGTAAVTLIQNALANGKPVAIALPIRPGFDAVTAAAWHDDDVTGTSRGNHEVLALAYDQYGLWVQNSWSTRWGTGGFARLSWRVVQYDVYQAHTISGFASRPAADTTPPAMGAVTQQLPLGYQATSTQTPVHFSWSASDIGGVSAYDVYWTTNNGVSWVKDTGAAATATAIVRFLGNGTTYRYAVRAKDTAGNWSAFVLSAPVTPRLTDDRAFTIATPWARYALGDTIGGSYVATSKAAATMQYTFTGREAAVIAPRFSTAGRATLFCDGVSSGLIDLYGSTTVGRSLAGRCRFSISGSHTIKLVVEGTYGRPWFGVDAFTFLQ